jgi:hypothetical protein
MNLGYIQGLSAQGSLFHLPMAGFAKKAGSATTKSPEGAGTETKKRTSKKVKAVAEEPVAPKKSKKAQKQEEEKVKTPVLHKIYTLKFNSPILPFAKFPLTQNKYIQDFLRKYEDDKAQVTRIIGVHFPNNSNNQAQDCIGIEIEIAKKNNITVVESNSHRRFKVKSYDEVSNFCLAEDYEDLPLGGPLAKNHDDKTKDLLMSEIFELKNLWFTFNKKMNSVLSILP